MTEVQMGEEPMSERLRERLGEAEAEAMNSLEDYDRRGERLWRLAALAGHEPHESDNDATAEMVVRDALAERDALRERLAKAEALADRMAQIHNRLHGDVDINRQEHRRGERDLARWLHDDLRAALTPQDHQNPATTTQEDR